MTETEWRAEAIRALDETRAGLNDTSPAWLASNEGLRRLLHNTALDCLSESNRIRGLLQELDTARQRCLRLLDQ